MMNVFLFCFVFLGGFRSSLRTHGRVLFLENDKKKKKNVQLENHDTQKKRSLVAYFCFLLNHSKWWWWWVIPPHSFFFYYYFCVKQLPTTKPPSPPITPICWTGVVLRIVQHVWKKKKNRVRLFLANVSVHTDTYVMTHFPRKRFFLFSFSSLGDAVFSLHLN